MAPRRLNVVQNLTILEDDDRSAPAKEEDNNTAATWGDTFQKVVNFFWEGDEKAEEDDQKAKE